MGELEKAQNGIQKTTCGNMYINPLMVIEYKGRDTQDGIMTLLERVQSLVEGIEADVNRLICDAIDTTHFCTECFLVGGSRVVRNTIHLSIVAVTH